MTLDNLGDHVPPFLTHHRSHRRLQARRGEQHARAGLGERRGQRVGQESLFVAVDAVQPIAVLRRQRDHAGVGESLGENRVFRRRDHVQGDRQRVLAAVRNEEIRDIGRHPETREPSRHDLALGEDALMRQVAEQR